MPAPGANEIEQRSFPTSFRGFDQEAVREFLEEVADAVRGLETEVAELRADAEAMGEVGEINEDTVTRFLGEETTRVLIAAREAASEIRAKAEESVARLVREASDDANRIRGDAERQVRERVEEAEVQAARIREAATIEAAAVRAEAERLRGEAEEVAAAVRLAADDHARTARLEAERDADRIRADAAELAAADTEAAKRDGRALLEEAKQIRQKVLDDLAVKRKAGRIQLEQLRGGRDRLLEAYDVVRRTLSEATSELEFSVDAARTAADQAARRAEIEPTPGAEDLEVELAARAESEPGIEADPAVDVDVDVETPPDESDEADEPVASEVPDIGDIDAIFARLRLGKSETPAAAEPVAEVDLAPETAAGADESDESAEPDESDESVADADVESPAARSASDESLVERRDAATDAVEQQLARRLKRVLADEQNEVLDRLRRDPAGGTRAVLPGADEQTARYAERATDDLGEAAAAGRAFFGASSNGGGGSAVNVVDLAAELASAIASQIRHRVEHTLVDLAGDEDAMADGIRACYREWKTKRIGDTARHYVLAAFSRGVYESVPAQTCLRWLVDDGGSPCPDAEDNALAGLLARGEPFPTGHQHPPAHPGCRCLVVPELR